jgi:transposase
MKSTGVYWIPLYELLESRGFTVLLVNARHVKNVSGRKSNVLDCQWLQQLISFGLLRGAFRPPEQVCVLRSLSRQRTMLLRSQGRFVQHIQKALTQMNIQLANVISNVAGETGQKILRTIVAGECDAQIQDQLQALHVREDEPAKGKKRGRARNAPKFDLRTQIFQICGVDLTRIDGIDVTTALVVVSEVGADMSKFPSDKHFAS